MLLLPAGSALAAQGSGTGVKEDSDSDTPAYYRVYSDFETESEADPEEEVARDAEADPEVETDPEDDSGTGTDEDPAADSETDPETETDGDSGKTEAAASSQINKRNRTSLLGSPSVGLLGGTNEEYYKIGGKFFPRVNLSSYYNGTNIIINFDILLAQNDNIHCVNMGWTGELFCANARRPNGTGAAENTSSQFGTVTYTNVGAFWYGKVEIAGYITITDVTGLENWYNTSNHAFWYSTYQDSGGTDDSRVCTDLNPMSITGLSSAVKAAKCTHNFIYEAVDASTHRRYCNKCGLITETGPHNQDLADTTSNPGYTITRCSACGYISAVTPNTYTVVLDGGGATQAGTGSVSVVFQTDMPAITVPQRSGYEFQGFYAGQNGTGTKYYTETGTSAHVYDIAGNTTLYPLWKQVSEVTLTATVQNEFGFAGV